MGKVEVLVTKSKNNCLLRTQFAEEPYPELKTPGSACWDLHAWIEEPLDLEVGHPVAVPTGLEIAIPEGYEGQIRIRSGLACKSVIVANAPGTIDSDYRGEVKVLLLALWEPYQVQPGQRIAQIAIREAPAVEWARVNELPPTIRGSGGFGSTGL